MTVIELSQVLGNFGEFFGAIAVVVTLAYLVVQIRQNTRSLNDSRELAKAQAYQTRAEMVHEFWLRQADSEELTRIQVVQLAAKP